MCLLGQCGWGKEGLTLSLYSSTRDALLCDVVKVIQESWYEVLEGWFQCWCHAKLWSYFQGVRFLTKSALLRKRHRANPKLRNCDKYYHEYIPWHRKYVYKAILTQKATSICSQGKLPSFQQEPYWHLHFADVKMALRWEEGHRQKIKMF